MRRHTRTRPGSLDDFSLRAPSRAKVSSSRALLCAALLAACGQGRELDPRSIQEAVTTNPAGNLDQCANGADGTIACANAAWQNGNLNANQAQYFEGDSVPYRLRMSGLGV